MIIKDLEKMRSMTATSKMMKMAAGDTLQKRKKEGYRWETTAYTNGLYMRCHVQDNILKVAIFLTEYMKAGARRPAYELYISKKRKQFITYDLLNGKWSNSKLDRLNWPTYVYNADNKWVSPQDNETIQKYLGCEASGYDALLRFQLKIRKEELLRQHKKETDPWDEDLKQVPALPKDWKRWASKVGVRENYIYYHYSKKEPFTGYCTFCDKDVPIKKPKHNAKDKCSRCRREVTLKSAGRAAGVVVTKSFQMYLLQRCKDGVIIRQFEGFRRHLKDKYKKPECVCHEVRRSFFDSSGQALRAYYWGQYKQRDHRWIKGRILNPGSQSYWSSWGTEDGKVYGKTLPHLAKNELSRTGLFELLKDTDIVDPESYLAVVNRVPQLEQLAKAKLPRMARECLSNHNNFLKHIHNENASALTVMLGINTQELKRLRLNNGGLRFLSWLKLENAAGKIIQDRDISWLCSEKITPDDIQFIWSKMNIVQICNYIRRQMSAHRMTSKEVLTTWADYLSMAARLKMNTDDEIIFRVNKLRQRHDELVERCHSKDIGLRAGEILEDYPHVDEICEALKEKYEYADDEYSIVAPTRIEDILLEGENLHHCLDKSDRYWERIERRETYVLFLRRSSDVGKSYYTLEVEPNGTVRQTRTMYDQQNKDIEEARSFLRKWQSVISKRLTHEDKMLADESRVLRNLNYAQLRKDQKIINTGALQGQLLVDVLLADLLETAVV